MSIIERTYQGYIVEYLSELPESAKQITKIYNKEVKSIYWYDILNKRLIKENGKKEKYPYRYLRAESIGIALKDGTTMRRKSKDVINWLWRCWCAKCDQQ